ncbi:uncharacterized protein BJ212DRAFT_1296480 [Suillus subaureus]|uniref:Uncharacterized protein n=1 Tax=Suillus subaureus TaxID=48587 RepID=A0A9P7EK73_9AGAM|nr:uncharacterized protein BJ212DRAFT_1296480 [Suillus subaureus]KAG1823970.1 hypothetical protein BJ212DRAFT_1296480 [Suillus subaureus]
MAQTMKDVWMSRQNHSFGTMEAQTIRKPIRTAFTSAGWRSSLPRAIMGIAFFGAHSVYFERLQGVLLSDGLTASREFGGLIDNLISEWEKSNLLIQYFYHRLLIFDSETVCMITACFLSIPIVMLQWLALCFLTALIAFSTQEVSELGSEFLSAIFGILLEVVEGYEVAGELIVRMVTIVSRDENVPLSVTPIVHDRSTSINYKKKC